VDGIPTANDAAWQAWDGPNGAFWADRSDHFNRAVAGYDPWLARAAAVMPGERVLDVGCGSGRTTCEAARRAGPDGHALGVDLSTRLLELARARAAAEGLDTVSFLQADAQMHPFAPGGVDLVVSRHGVMFFEDPVAAFANFAAALRRGGRLALLVWAALEDNHFLVRVLDALTPGRDTPLPPTDGRPSPVAFADPDHVRRTLTAAGFVDVALEPVAEPMIVGTDVADALQYQSGLHAGLLADLPPPDRELALQRLRDDLAAHLEPGRGVLYPSSCWLVTASTPA